MKAEFEKVSSYEKAAAKAKLYAKSAMVVTLSFRQVSVDDTTLAPAQIRAGFLRYLRDNDIPHAIIHEDGEMLTYATRREKGEGEPKARAAVAGYFKDEMADALTMQAYFQEHTHGPVIDNDGENRRVISLHDRVEVARNLRRLRRAA